MTMLSALQRARHRQPETNSYSLLVFMYWQYCCYLRLLLVGQCWYICIAAISREPAEPVCKMSLLVFMYWQYCWYLRLLLVGQCWYICIAAISREPAEPVCKMVSVA